MSTEPHGRRTVAVLAAACALLLVAVVVLGVLAAKWHGDAQEASDKEAAGRAALAAAKADLVDIGTYDADTYATDTSWHDDFVDAEVAKPFLDNQKAFAKAMQQTGTSSTTQVTDAMDRVISTDQVEVLAFVDAARVFTDEHGKRRGVLEKQRVTMTMKRVGGDWKIARVDLVGGENNG